MAFRIESPAFREGEAIPKKYTCEGENRSPELHWSGAPATARSLALIVDDPDAPVGTWNHWLLWNIPANAAGLKEGFRPGDAGESGSNDFNKAGYGGPCPPRGHGRHRYFFKLFALDVASIVVRGQGKRVEMDRALDGHVIAEAQLMGTYERK